MIAIGSRAKAEAPSVFRLYGWRDTKRVSIDFGGRYVCNGFLYWRYNATDASDEEINLGSVSGKMKVIYPEPPPLGNV